MSKSRDILVGLTIKPNAAPKEITESFDGENEGVNYSKLMSAFKNLKTDLKKHYTKFSKETISIETKIKSFK